MAIATIMKRNGLTRPDGRPLYEYGVSDAEFHELLKVLRGRAGWSLSRWQAWESVEFCLYVAEWWRRFYAGGSWSWDGALEPLELQPWDTLSRAATRSEIVRRGIQHLSRELIELDSRTQYLGTLATEGGLPLRLISQENNALRAIFRKLFDDLQAFNYGIHALERHARYLSNTLPQTYQQVDTLPHLLARMASKIWQLTRLLDAEEDPVEALNQKQPGWQRELPMRVDEDGARAFFRQIMGDAAQARRVEWVDLKVLRQLVKTQDGWALEARVELPESISSDQVASLLEVPAQSLPYQFSLHARLGQKSVPVASLSRQKDQKYRVRTLSVDRIAHGARAADTIGLVGYHGMNEWAAPAAPMAQPAGDGPWVFSPPSAENPARFLGSDSVRTRHESVLVALPPTIQIDPDFEHLAAPLGEINALQRRVYRVSESVELYDGEGARWRVRCADLTAEHTQLWVRGASNQYRHARGIAIFDTDPEVQVSVSYQINETIFWRSTAGEQRPWAHAAYGDGRLRIYDTDGHIALQQRACRLPREARVRAVARTPRRPGQLILENFGPIEVAAPSSAIELRCEGDATRLVIDCTYSGDEGIPAEFLLRIRWPGQGETLLAVPFPAEKSRFVALGQSLRDNAIWNVHALDQVRAEWTDSQLSKRRPFIHGKLFAADLSDELCAAAEFEAFLEPEMIGQQFNGRYLLPLGRIRSFVELALAGTMDLDAHVLLTLLWDGHARRLKLRRYEGEVVPHGASTFQVLPPCADTEDDRDVELHAFRFQDMAQVHKLVATTDNEWLVPAAMSTPGTWCVVGTRYAQLSHRPYIFTQLGPTPDTDWERTCEIAHRDERRESFRELFRVMASSPAHPAWAQLGATFSGAEQLPATTFDALDCLVQVPQAVTMAMLLAGGHRIERWWSELEELPFAWYLLSYSDWARAICQYHAFMQEHCAQLQVALDATQLYQALLDIIEAHLEGASPIFVHLDERLKLGLNLRDTDRQGLLAARYADDTLQALLDEEFNKLLIRKNLENAQWPDWNPTVDVDELRLFGKIRYAVDLHWRRAVADAPVLAALAAATNLRLGRPDIIRIRRMHDFDPTWFNLCYRISLIRALVALEDQPEFARLITLLEEQL